VEEFKFTAVEPLKNGFTGKGAEKLVQKLVGSNHKQTILSSTKHYILLITALNIGCKDCDVSNHIKLVILRRVQKGSILFKRRRHNIWSY
jgi:hypothetical protein